MTKYHTMIKTDGSLQEHSVHDTIQQAAAQADLVDGSVVDDEGMFVFIDDGLNLTTEQRMAQRMARKESEMKFRDLETFRSLQRQVESMADDELIGESDDQTYLIGRLQSVLTELQGIDDDNMIQG